MPLFQSRMAYRVSRTEKRIFLQRLFYFFNWCKKIMPSIPFFCSPTDEIRSPGNRLPRTPYKILNSALPPLLVRTITSHSTNNKDCERVYGLKSVKNNFFRWRETTSLRQVKVWLNTMKLSKFTHHVNWSDGMHVFTSTDDVVITQSHAYRTGTLRITFWSNPAEMRALVVVTWVIRCGPQKDASQVRHSKWHHASNQHFRETLKEKFSKFWA